jgi:hypothetical protein
MKEAEDFYETYPTRWHVDASIKYHELLYTDEGYRNFIRKGTFLPDYALVYQ